MEALDPCCGEQAFPGLEVVGIIGCLGALVVAAVALTLICSFARLMYGLSMSDAVVLSAICLFGLGLSVWMILAWGRLPVDRQPLLVESAEPRELMSRTLRMAVVGIVGGIIAGVLVAGLGGRLMMRILAATSGDSSQGLVTEAHEIVGEITMAGSIGFVVFNGIFFGMIGGIGYPLVRRWLPSPSWLGGFFYGIALLGLAPLDALNPDNTDFSILRPSWLAVLLVCCLFPLYGMTVASVAERLDRSWPGIGTRPRGILACSPLLLALIVPPIGLGIMIAVGLVVVLDRHHRFVEAWHGRVTTIVGQMIAGVLLLAATLSASWATLDILDTQ